MSPQHAFVQVLARNPDNVILGLVRDKEAAVTQAKSDGLRNVHYFQADITDRQALFRAREEMKKIGYEVIDCLINNAAYVETNTAANGLDDFEENFQVVEAELEKSFAINVVGIISTISVFLPYIRKSIVKKIVVISSGMADLDLVNSGSIWNTAPYSISKAAVNMAVAKFSARLKLEGILVFALSPGVVSTYEVETPAIEELRRMMPQWAGPLTPTLSAEMCLKVIRDSSVEKGNGGLLVSHYGNKQWL